MRKGYHGLTRLPAPGTESKVKEELEEVSPMAPPQESLYNINEILAHLERLTQALEALPETIANLVMEKGATPKANPEPKAEAPAPTGEAAADNPGNPGEEPPPDGETKEVIIESSNPGPEGADTGYTFEDPKTGETIRVMKKKNESKEEAIARVRKAHGL